MAKHLTVSEVVETTNRGRSTVYADIKRGVLAATTNRDGKIVVTPSAVKAYSRTLGISPTFVR